jgi:AcrR family transcriptional regulator
MRDKERTRHEILTAAQRVITERGTGVSLASIATEAGVSKSGLLHHFPSRDDLVAGLVDHVVEQTWHEIASHVDVDDTRPGAFARGYVRALTGDSEYLRELHSSSGLLATVGTEVGIEAFGADDAVRLNAAFEADGLPPARALAVRYAAEGVALSLHTPYLTEEQRLTVRAELLALTET